MKEQVVRRKERCMTMGFWRSGKPFGMQFSFFGVMELRSTGFLMRANDVWIKMVEKWTRTTKESNSGIVLRHRLCHSLPTRHCTREPEAKNATGQR